MRFSDLTLIDPILRAVAEDGYETPTPIQVQAIPHVLAGRDLLAIAQTGTGKTAAFALPILQRLAAAPPPGSRRPIRALVLAPTRELAAQVGEAFREYGRNLPLRCAVVFGGVPQRPQARAIADGVDVLVATPGRLLDLLGQRLVGFDRLQVLVLDEADRMLDMGFLPAVRRILAAVPRRRQTLFFSATMDREPKALADSILVDAARVEVAPQATTVEKVAQSVYFVEKSDKQALLEHLLADETVARALVFTRTKHGANRVAEKLSRAGIDAEAIHANKSQRQRERALSGFRAGHHRVLVATDIAARGIDVDDISHVVNFDLPNVPESYVHRIGRTARAGATGAALSFCDGGERAYLRAIEREIRMHVPVVADHPFARGGGRPGGVTPVESPAHLPGAPAPTAWVEAPTDGDGGHHQAARSSHRSHGAHGASRAPDAHRGHGGHRVQGSFRPDGGHRTHGTHRAPSGGHAATPHTPQRAAHAAGDAPHAAGHPRPASSQGGWLVPSRRRRGGGGQRRR